MTIEIVEFLLEKAEQLGTLTVDKVGEGIEWLYPVALRQVYVRGVFSVMFGVLGIGLAVYAVKCVVWNVRRIKEGYDDFEDFNVFLWSVAFIILAIAGFVSAKNGAFKLLNPNYYVVETIKTMLK